jgi:Glycosyltransferase
MKVVFVIVSLAGGGAERVISILANQFVKKNIDVTIMMTAGDTVAYPLDKRIHLLCIGGTSGGSMRLRLRRIRKMREYFKANRDTVIISFGPGTSFFAVAASLFLKHRILISERNDPAICPHKKLRNMVYARAERLIFQTEDAKQCFPDRIKRKGIVIPNPVSGNLPAEYEGVRKKEIAAVGRLETQKNHRMLLQAFAMFHKEFPAYSLHLFGEGSLKEELERLAEQLKIKEQVVFEGFASNVPERIREMEMYVLSSDYEGISNSLLEAMAVGLPCVSTDCPIGGSRLCIDPGENGLLTPIGDAAAFAEAMGKIAADRNFAEKLSRNAREIREAYSEGNISDQWADVIGVRRKE